jgi:transcriptional regulator
MYIPKHFDEADVAAMHALMRAKPLATLITQNASGGIEANHIPLITLDQPSNFGCLQGP